MYVVRGISQMSQHYFLWEVNMRSVSRILTIMYDRTIMMPFKLLLFF